MRCFLFAKTVIPVISNLYIRIDTVTTFPFVNNVRRIGKLFLLTCSTHLVQLTENCTERDLEIAIQACLDIANHLIARLGLDLPKKDRKETFSILAKNNIIPQNLVPDLTAMAGQRNILIHEYLEW